MTLTDATVTDNTATSAANVSDPGTLQSDRSVVALPQGGGDDCSQPAASSSYSAESGSSCGFTGIGSLQNQTPADLALGALADNGGPTLTQLPADGSSLIDVVPTSETSCSGGDDADQRGIARPQRAACDIGAVEAADDTDPGAAIVTPAQGASYDLDAVVNAAYTCSDDVAIATCVGDVDAGQPIDTSSLGTHTFTVVATDTSGHTTTVQASYDVVEPPPPPTVVPGAAAPVVEPDGSGTVTMSIPIDLSGPYGQTVSVDWLTVDVPGNPVVASAADGDYVAASGTVVFAPGQTEAFVTVTVNGDSLPEPDEVVVIATGNPVHATIGGFYGLGFGQIIDNDTQPTVVPGAAAPVVEPDGSGTVTMSIPIDLSGPYGQTVSVDWLTVDVPGNPVVASAADGDYVAASGTVVFAPGQTEAFVTVTVNGDSLPEPDEVVVIATGNPVHATIGGFYGLGFGQIIDND